MGVTKLGDLFEERQEVEFDFFANRTIAFDGNNILYQFLTSIRQADGRLLTDEEGNVTSHLTGLLYRVTKLLEKNIKVVFIFDGEPPELKHKEITKRKKKKKAADIAYEEALEKGDMKLAQKYAQRTTRLTSPIIEDAKRLLGLMGIPVVQAPSEGEGQAAYMAEKGDVWGSCSQDYDSILFGTPILIRNLTVSGRRKLPNKNVYVSIKPEIIYLEKTLENLDISRKQLIDIGIMLGTDFNPDGIDVRGIGPKTSYKLIKKHGALEKVLELPKLKEANMNFDIDQIRNIFLDPEVKTDYALKWKPLAVEEIVEFLVKERDFSESRVQSALEKVINIREEKRKQPKLDSFFG
ncbi:MAG: flap endonuclease-1 [Asgard group archaeon]|nr:flap endonuclease-1 [Asgard group archaeon]